MPVDSSAGARRLAAAICGAQALVLAGFAVFYLYELAIGEGTDAGGVVVASLLIGGAALALAVLARGWLGEAQWPRSPTIVWNLLLLPVGWSLVQAGQGLGWAVLGVGLVGAVVAFAARDDRDLPGAGDPDETV